MSASTSFAVTKIQPPRARAGFIARDALHRRLGDAALGKRLTLLVAPAGFGKTVALTRLVRDAAPSTALAWVAADADDDLHRLLTCLCEALDPFDLPWRADPAGLIASASRSRADRRDIAAEMLNALAACEVAHGRIVLDDMHRVTDPAVFEFLDLLLERLPERWSVLLASRSEPPLSLGRLRVADELAEFRQHDLQFSRDEVGQLVQSTPGAAAGRIDPDQLHRRTLGWPAGLGLMLRTPEPRAASGAVMDRHLFDYLASEVLDDMPLALREFLLRCSVLAELTAARCAAVSCDAQAAQWLDEIDRRGLFATVLEGAELTLRLHDLFRDFLEDRLVRERPDELPAILIRAAAGEPDPLRHVGYLIRAAAWDEAVTTLERVCRPLISVGAIEPVLRLLEQFPLELRAVSGTLAEIRGLCAWARWDWGTMRDEMRRARTLYARSGQAPAHAKALIYESLALNGVGRLAESRALLAPLPRDALTPHTALLLLVATYSSTVEDGRLDTAARGFTAVMDRVEAIDDLPVWYQCLPRLLHIGLPGMHAPVRRFADGALRRIGDTPSPLRGIVRAITAWLALRQGEVPQALAWLRLAQEDERWAVRQSNVYMVVETVRALVCVALGRHADARQASENVFAYFDSPTLPRDERMDSAFGHFIYFALRIAHALGDAAAVRALAARLPRAEVTDELALREQRRVLPARLAELDGDALRTAQAWTDVLLHATVIDVHGQADEARLRGAAAWLALGRTDDAAALLTPLFEHVHGTGDLTGVLLAGAATRSALAEADWRGRLDAAQRAQLRGWTHRFAPPDAADGAGTAPFAADTPTPSGLSHREREVLQRIAAGDSNKLIARAFELSPHTVKRHVANILDKLALQSRGQAAAWYRDHGSV